MEAIFWQWSRFVGLYWDNTDFRMETVVDFDAPKTNQNETAAIRPSTIL